MEEQDEVSPEYLKGFNEGYLIGKENPALAEKLASIDSDFIRLAGFKDGRKQYQAEQVRERLPSWLSGNRPVKDLSTPDKKRGRDIEPEKD